MRYCKSLQNLTLVISAILCVSVPAKAKIFSGKCQPYFASLRVKQANLHIGPGKYYKVICKYICKGVPFLITAKYDHWRKVTDPDGTTGWLHKNQLSKQRFVVVKSNNNNLRPLLKESKADSKVIARLKSNLIMRLIEIRGEWCYAQCLCRNKTYRGWVNKNHVFGIFPNEINIL